MLAFATPLQCTFAPTVVQPTAMRARVSMSAADGMEGVGDETGFAVFDPLGLADLGSPATLSFFRHAELKHCRVSMAAFLGWLVATGNQLAVSKGGEGIHFPGLCSFSGGVSFADIAAAGGPMEQWAAVPAEGKFQILLAIGIIEHQSEWKLKPHYMAGGTPGDLKGLKSFWDPVGLTSKCARNPNARCVRPAHRLSILQRCCATFPAPPVPYPFPCPPSLAPLSPPPPPRDSSDGVSPAS